MQGRQRVELGQETHKKATWLISFFGQLLRSCEGKIQLLLPQLKGPARSQVVGREFTGIPSLLRSLSNPTCTSQKMLWIFIIPLDPFTLSLQFYTIWKLLKKKQ